MPYRKDETVDGPLIRANLKAETGPIQVQYDGEYVLTRDGNRDFGEISPEIARIIRRQTGKIRLRVGEQAGRPGDYGEKHIERRARFQELNSNRYQNARDLVQDAAQNWERPKTVKYLV
jgi:hypothetical protein